MGDHEGKPAETKPFELPELPREQQDGLAGPGKHEKPKPEPKK